MMCRLIRVVGPLALGAFVFVTPSNLAGAPSALIGARDVGRASMTRGKNSSRPPASIGMLRTPAKGNTYSYSVELSDPDPGSEPEPEPEFAILHGPAVDTSAERDVSVNFPCQASIWDDEGYFNDFTIWLHLLGPNGSEISPTPDPRWTSTKPSLTANNTWTVSDPAEGVYTCKADLYVYGTYLGSPTSQKTLTYTVPTGETSAMDGWVGPHLRFKQTLTGGTFSGRVVHEENGSGSTDNCHWSGSSHSAFESLTGGTWTVASDGTWGDDELGWATSDITYYRAQGRTPCQTTLAQKMLINRPGTTDVVYSTSNLELGITNTTVWNKRLGVRGDTTYP